MDCSCSFVNSILLRVSTILKQDFFRKVYKLKNNTAIYIEILGPLIRALGLKTATGSDDITETRCLQEILLCY